MNAVKKQTNKQQNSSLLHRLGMKYFSLSLYLKCKVRIHNLKFWSFLKYKICFWALGCHVKEKDHKVQKPASVIVWGCVSAHGVGLLLS